MAVNAADAFEHFFDESEPFVRRALVSRFGAELGRDATAEGFAAAWRSWDRVSAMENRSGSVLHRGHPIPGTPCSGETLRSGVASQLRAEAAHQGAPNEGFGLIEEVFKRVSGVHGHTLSHPPKGGLERSAPHEMSIFWV